MKEYVMVPEQRRAKEKNFESPSREVVCREKRNGGWSRKRENSITEFMMLKIGSLDSTCPLDEKMLLITDV